VRVGNLVGQDQPTLLATVSQTDPIRVTFPISEVDYVKYPERFKNLDQRNLAWAKVEFAKPEDDRNARDGAVQLVLSDGSVYPRRGVVVSVNRNIDASTGTLQMQALFPNPEGLLRPGQYGRVRLQRGSEGAAVLAVPEKALIAVQGSYSLGIVGPDNKVSVKPVQLGPSVGGLRVVTGGASEGDRVVVDGTQRVADGVAVDPHPAAAPSAAASSSPASPQAAHN
jgi:membrane fusion protein (multidrug efflux system)